MSKRRQRVRCTEVASSGKWRIGTTGAPRFDSEEACIKIWNQMNGGNVYKPRATGNRLYRKQQEGRKTTIIRRNGRGPSE